MHRCFRIVVFWPAVLFALAAIAQTRAESPIAFAIHGGAGTIPRDSLTQAQYEAYEQALGDALDAGYAVLREGGQAVDAVAEAVVVMENNALFNAGVGAVFTWDQTHELDASVMRGDTLAAGAVSGVKTVRNPILTAIAVMNASPHVLLTGSGAEQFAREQQQQMVENDFFSTPRRLQQLQRAKEKAEADSKLGTVGAVALDRHGNLAAGTSTGGMTAKRWGRVGDSPIIGAGTYADNAYCAVSATGHGEFFIRHAVAYDICARVRYTGQSVRTAAQSVIHDTLTNAGGTGGVIVLSPSGEVGFVFNTEGMYRAGIDGQGRRTVAIYADERAR